MLVCQHRNARSVRERKVQRPLLILAPLFFMINSPVTGVVITQVPVPVTTNNSFSHHCGRLLYPCNSFSHHCGRLLYPCNSFSYLCGKLSHACDGIFARGRERKESGAEASGGEYRGRSTTAGASGAVADGSASIAGASEAGGGGKHGLPPSRPAERDYNFFTKRRGRAPAVAPISRVILFLSKSKDLFGSRK